MRVLVACEFSGTVRDAFIRAGHDAVSCDLLPSESDFGPHHQGNALDLLHDGFDLMVCHPPCTYLSDAGRGHWHKPGRAELRAEAVAFALALYHSPIPLVAMENPKGYLSEAFRPADQYVNPYQFGEPVRKRTGLWLKGLPPLVPTHRLPAPAPLYVDKSGKARHYIDSIQRGSDQWKKRSHFFVGIAEAMAKQWGDVTRLNRTVYQTSLF